MNTQNDNDSDELFFRQVHSSWVTSEGTVALAAFRPTTKDQRKLSVSSSAKFDAESAYQKHIQQGLLSRGSVGVSESEVAAAYTSLDAREKSTIVQTGSVVRDNEPFEGHAHIDFSELTKRECKSVAASLSDASNDRGWLYQPDRAGIPS